MALLPAAAGQTASPIIAHRRHFQTLMLTLAWQY
jgi:hypothetical protein